MIKWQNIVTIIDALSLQKCSVRDGLSTKESTFPRCMTATPLIVRTCNWVGEAILSVPALQLLESHDFSPRLIGKRWAADLLSGYAWPVVAQPATHGARLTQWRQLRRQANAEDSNFDRRLNTLLLTNSFSSALQARLSGLRALGYRRDGRSLLLAKGEKMPSSGHALVSYWRLACSFLGIDTPPPPAINWRIAAAAQLAADARIEQHGLAGGFVLICPFAATSFEKQGKTWPGFDEYARSMLAAGHHLMVCPGPGERSRLSSELPGVTALLGVGLGEYAGLLKRAALVVSNDTGPAHLAAAVGAPLISVLGPTNPDQWRPWGPSVTVVRQWPSWPSVDEVVTLSRAMLLKPKIA